MMRMPNRAVLGCVGVTGLFFVGMGTLVILNRDVVSRNLAEALDTQAERTQATLFRLGELMSIGAELKARYGTEPDVTYDTASDDRILSISFSNYQLPGKVTTEDHAREIAAFAIGRTTKFEQIDAVRVLFLTSSGSESYSFARDDLMPNQPQAWMLAPLSSNHRPSATS